MRHSLALVLAASLFPAVAVAQTADDPDTNKDAPPTAPQNLPPAESDSDTQPEVASPAMPPEGLVSQAGVGGITAYGRPGVLELGGSAGFRIGNGFNEVTVSPSIGWFVADNIELTGILDVAHVDTGENDATLFSALVEPSYHLPFNRTVFGFLGLGLGGSYVSELGGGFAMAPRLGANLLVGRSGILTPSVSWQYTTHDLDSDNTDNTTLVAVSSALRLNVGYTVMW